MFHEYVVHGFFDVLAWLAAAFAGWWVNRALPTDLVPHLPAARAYLTVLIIGTTIGAYAIGTLNLVLGGDVIVARSIAGALFGAILSIEVYKRFAGIHVRTGARFAAPLSLGIAVGRIGCLLSGMDDLTYGVPTSLPWGWNFGDGAPRHPVALYESLSMALFLLAYVVAMRRRNRFIMANGFYLAVGWYGLQRFAWEFLKPYAHVVGVFNLFHIVCALFVFYAAAMLCASSQKTNVRLRLA